MSTFRELATVLQNTPAGLVAAETRDEVVKLLVKCWSEFAGSTDSSMAPWKLERDGGATDIAWNPPVLTFIVERHGATVLGSTRAEKQRWRLNLQNKTAEHCSDGFRQLYRTAPRLNVKPIVVRVFEAVRQGPRSNSELVSKGILVWEDDDQILVRHGILIPDNSYAMTTSGRRRRFRAELTRLLAADGWQFVEVRRAMIFKRRQAPLKLVTTSPHTRADND
jgi:hypothetical protein